MEGTATPNQMREVQGYWNLPATTTLCWRTPLAHTKHPWHSPNGKYHNQIDYIMVRKRFRSCVNIAKTRSFPGADIGSDHEPVMMTFKLHLKRVKKLGHARIKFDLEKLKDPEVAEAFHAMIGGKFAALTILDADGTDMDTLINTFHTAVTNTASEPANIAQSRSPGSQLAYLICATNEGS